MPIGVNGVRFPWLKWLELFIKVELDWGVWLLMHFDATEIFKKSSIISNWLNPSFSWVRFSSSAYLKKIISWGSWIWENYCSKGYNLIFMCLIYSWIDPIALSISIFEEEFKKFYFSLLLDSLSFKLFFIVYSVSIAKLFTFLAMKQQTWTFVFEDDWERNFSIIFIPLTIFCLFSRMFCIIFFSISEMLGVDLVFFIVSCGLMTILCMILLELDWYWRIFYFSF